MYTVSFTVLQPVVCTVACIKHDWHLQSNMQPNIQNNTHEVYTAIQSVVIPVVSLGRCDWLVAAGCHSPPQATISCRLVGVNIIRAAIWTWRFWSTEECDRLIEEIRKYELLWKSDSGHKDYEKHGPHLVAWKKIASTLDRGYSSFCTNRINHSRHLKWKIAVLNGTSFPTRLYNVTWKMLQTAHYLSDRRGVTGRRSL